MDRAGLPKDILDGAYRIFIQEIESHLAALSFVLEADRTPEHDLPSVEDAKMRFHKIKGGAGFFGLGELERKAAELERILREMPQDEVLRAEGIRAHYQDLVRIIRSSVPEAR